MTKLIEAGKTFAQKDYVPLKEKKINKKKKKQ